MRNTEENIILLGGNNGCHVSLSHRLDEGNAIELSFRIRWLEHERFELNHFFVATEFVCQMDVRKLD